MVLWWFISFFLRYILVSKHLLTSSILHVSCIGIDASMIVATPLYFKRSTCFVLYTWVIGCLIPSMKRAMKIMLLSNSKLEASTDATKDPFVRTAASTWWGMPFTYNRRTSVWYVSGNKTSRVRIDCLLFSAIWQADPKHRYKIQQAREYFGNNIFRTLNENFDCRRVQGAGGHEWSKAVVTKPSFQMLW